ncbi:MAG: sigma-70 family RNA polymerase sigma factor [Candidatus Eisenbacteria bacterium]|uniref:Sigma-70 family RNA polymerase sigma factor n=1 Tax=Eiseniibacteriota bacterium TaxID=2212470 RepID=A0A956RQI2_UNCEI|nr:sigma-70 family RNA polymerase sigma factor [Candidatus Eisenbacteria bacterium]
MNGSGDVTQLLMAHRAGNGEALDRLLPLVYADLRRIARAHVAKGPISNTLQPTALINEAYLRLIDQTKVQWEDRQHFLAVCARAMRQIVISNARKNSAAKRGGGRANVAWDDALSPGDGKSDWLLRLDRALEALGEQEQRLARVVECRYFAGFTEEETAHALGSSLRTVQRDWKRAQAWLRIELGDEGGGPGPAGNS